MRAAPEVPCAMSSRLRARAYRAAENIRHPLRNGFTAYSVLSPENGSFASVASRPYCQLDASTATSGPHVFAVRICRDRPSQHQRPPRPVPRRDDGQRPSERDGMAKDIPLLWPSDKAKYFLFWGLTRILQIGTNLPVGQFFSPCGKRRMGGRPLCPRDRSATVPPYNKRKRQWIWV